MSPLDYWLSKFHLATTSILLFIPYIDTSQHPHGKLFSHYSETTWISWRLKSPAPPLFFFNHLFRRASNKISKLCVTGLCEDNPLVASRSPHKGSVTRKMFLMKGKYPTSPVIFRTSSVPTKYKITDMDQSGHLAPIMPWRPMEYINRIHTIFSSKICH